MGRGNGGRRREYGKSLLRALAGFSGLSFSLPQPTALPQPSHMDTVQEHNAWCSHPSQMQNLGQEYCPRGKESTQRRNSLRASHGLKKLYLYIYMSLYLSINYLPFCHIALSISIALYLFACLPISPS